MRLQEKDLPRATVRKRKMPMHSPKRICTFLLTILKGKISILYHTDISSKLYFRNENHSISLSHSVLARDSFMPDLSRRDAHVS